MIIPLLARQAIAPTQAPTTTRTTATKSTITVSPPTSSSSSTSSGLATGVGTLNLSWWQLLCIALGGILATGVIGWAWIRGRNKSRADKAKAKKLEEEEEKRFAEMMQGKNKAGAKGGDGIGGIGFDRGKSRGRRRRDDSESEDSQSEDYDSFSDGGTIRPRRGRRDRNGKARKWSKGRRKDRQSSRRSRRRRDDETESESEETEESDASSEIYQPPTRRRRDVSPPRRPPLRHNPKSEYPPRQRRIPSPPPDLPIPRRQPNKGEKTFRDSVFSSYTSMKKAAVKLKHVEAKVKLKKQLEEEEAIEKHRLEKIKEANRGIFERYYRAAVGGVAEDNKGKRPDDSAGSSQPLMIPPVKRPATAHSSSASSSRTTPHLPTPPSRSHPHKQQSSDSTAPRRRNPANPLRQASNDSQKPLIPKYPPKPQRKPSTETTFDNQITRLLGSKHPHSANQAAVSKQRPTARPLQARAPQKKPSLQNAFQADWLSHPNPNLSLPVSPSATSIYIPVNRPQDRPMIPKGGLAPAPPPKVKVKDRPGVTSLRKTGGGSALGTGSGSGGSTAGVGGGGAKWADRLRAKR